MMYKSQKKHQTIQLNLKNIKERGTKVKNTFVSRSKHVQTAEVKATPSEIS